MNTTQTKNLGVNWVGTLFLALFATSLALGTTTAQALERLQPRYASGQVDINNPDRVDVALVLAVDVSSSIETDERRFQREAYAQALSDPRVANLALGGGAGRVAIAYMEWSGRHFQRVHLPMRVMSTPEELAQFAIEILAIPDHEADPMYIQPTAIGNALIAAEAIMASLPVPARDYVIDISGDGVVNDGTAVSAVRANLIELGLTVNGLPIEVSLEAPVFESLGPERVSQYYADCVIGGPGSFHVVARGFGDVRETLVMKLMLEMANLPPSEKQRLATAYNAIPQTLRVIPATALQIAPKSKKQKRPKTDCADDDVDARSPFQIIP